MRVRTFAIPARGGEEASDELSDFLSSHRVIAVDRQLVHDGPNSYWAVYVTIEGSREAKKATSGGRGSKRVDYREVLPEAQFAVFARLRELRKEIAEREKVPAYALFNNEHLATMVSEPITNAEALAGRRPGPGGEVRRGVPLAPAGVVSARGNHGRAARARGSRPRCHVVVR